MYCWSINSQEARSLYLWCIVGQLIPKKHVPYTSALVLGTLWGKFDEGDCTLGISLLSKLPLHDFALLGGNPVHLNLV